MGTVDASVTLLWLFGVTALVLLCMCCCQCLTKYTWLLSDAGPRRSLTESLSPADGEGGSTPVAASGGKGASDGDEIESTQSALHEGAEGGEGAASKLESAERFGGGSTYCGPLLTRNLGNTASNWARVWTKDLVYNVDGYQERYVLALDENRITVVFAKTQDGDLDTLLATNSLKPLSFKGVGQVRSVTVPLEHWTDASLRLQHTMTWWAWIVYRCKQFWGLMLMHMPVIIFALTVLALATMMYVPLQAYKYIPDGNYGHAAKVGRDLLDAGAAFLVLLILATLLHLYHGRKQISQSTTIARFMWWLGAVLVLWQITVLSVASYTTSLANVKDTTNTNDHQGSWFNQLTCACGSHDNQDYAPTQNSSDLDFVWECDTAYYVDANQHVCRMQCGQCAGKFHGAYSALMSMIFVFLVVYAVPLLVLHILMFERERKTPFEVPTFMEVTLHGSSDVGFPVRCAMEPDEAMDAVTHLTELRNNLRDRLPPYSKQSLTTTHSLLSGNTVTVVGDAVLDGLQTACDAVLGH